MTQPRPFFATKIHVDPSGQVEVSQSFHMLQAAKVLRHKSIDVDLREHEGLVT